jgi:hypothetical protein
MDGRLTGWRVGCMNGASTGWRKRVGEYGPNSWLPQHRNNGAKSLVNVTSLKHRNNGANVNFERLKPDDATVGDLVQPHPKHFRD